MSYIKMIKRITDIIISLIALIVLIPVFIIIILAVMADSPGRPFYGCERMGYKRIPFKMLKFRTMRADGGVILTEQQRRELSINFKIVNDPRITRIGIFLRKWSLDELPQFVNVLAGDMSLVGPRPKLLDELHLYGDNADKLVSVRPGLTGYWQVNRVSSASDKNMRKLDMLYIDQANLRMDFKILLKTILVVIRQEND